MEETKRKRVRRWIEALRSGDYKQTTGTLRKHDEGEDSYCCLGVMCDLYRGRALPGHWRESDPETFEIGDYTATNMPPSEVLDWFGISVDDSDSLANANDAGESFQEIARRIERLTK